MLPAPLLRRARPRHRAPARPPARRLWQPPEACRGDGAKAVRTTVERPRGCCAPRVRQDRVPKAPGARARSKRSLGPQEPPRRALARHDREPQAPGADSCTPFPSLPHARLQKGPAEHDAPGNHPVSTTRRLLVLSADGANAPSVAAPPHAPLVQGAGSATGKAPLLTTRSTPRRRHQSGKRRPRHLWVLEAARARCERLHELRRGGQNRALAAPRRRHAQRTEARRLRECAQRRTEAPDLQADQPCTPHPAPTENESHAPKERRTLVISARASLA